MILVNTAQERKVYYSYLTPEEQVALPARVVELEREVADLKLQLEKPVKLREELRDVLEKFESVWGSPLAGDVQAAGRQVVMAYRAAKESES